MGSAFPAEPWAREAIMKDAHKFVMFAFGWPDTVCHFAYDECPRSDPHDMADCGMFDHQHSEAEATR
jgi:hypothetical protein